MSALLKQGQLALLAKRLNVPVEQVEFLGKLSPEDIAALRIRISNLMFDDNAEVFKRVSALVPIIPLSIAIPIVQKVVHPAMAGRAAGAVAVAHPKKSVSAIAMLDVKYAAVAAPYIDPRAVEQIAHLAPHAPVVAIANKVLERKDYATAALFVDFATPELIRAVEAGVDDDEGILRAGAMILSGKTVSSVLRVIIEQAPGRISRVVSVAVNGPIDLQLVTLSVVERVDKDLVHTIGDVIFDETEPEVIATLVRNIIAEGAAPDLLRLAGSLSPHAMDVLAANPIMTDNDVISALVREIGEDTGDNVWLGMLELAERNSETHSLVGPHIGELSDGAVASLISAARQHDLLPTLLGMLAEQNDTVQQDVAKLWAPFFVETDRELVAAQAGLEALAAALPQG